VIVQLFHNEIQRADVPIMVSIQYHAIMTCPNGWNHEVLIFAEVT
jgi:hypothetical protein